MTSIAPANCKPSIRIRSYCCQQHFSESAHLLEASETLAGDVNQDSRYRRESLCLLTFSAGTLAIQWYCYIRVSLEVGGFLSTFVSLNLQSRGLMHRSFVGDVGNACAKLS